MPLRVPIELTLNGRQRSVDVLAQDGRLNRAQTAFLETGAVQCGFCIPGQLVSAHALLADVPQPTREQVEEGLAGNLCRCAGYEQIIEAVLMAAGDGRERRGARKGRAQPTAGPTGPPQTKGPPP